MINFNFESPTRIHFGKGVEKEVCKNIVDSGYHKCLLVYGKGSIFKLGLYDILIKGFKENNIQYYELGGIEANPKIDKVRTGVSIVKENNIDLILAVGGGSVIDTAKSIGVGACVDFDPYLFNMGLKKPEQSVPVWTILTISAAGSELSNSCVISDPERNLKRGFNSDIIRPEVSFLNPELTYSVSPYQTACGIVDILMHTLERYLVEDDFTITKNIAAGVMKTVLAEGKIVLEKPFDYDARANLMLASSLSHNGLTNLGLKMFFTVHKLEHELSGFYDEVAHAAGLSILYPAWARYVVKNHQKLFQKFAVEVLGLGSTNDSLKDALMGIDYLENYFKEIGMPTRLSDLNIPSIDILAMAKSATDNGQKEILGIDNLTMDDVIKIYESAK